MRAKVLEILKTAPDFVSGQEISKKTGISRTAVWKHINTLKKQGYEIESVTNKGYKLSGTAGKISPARISDALHTDFAGRKIYFYESCDSTNKRAKEEPLAPHGSVFVAERQDSGRGRRSRAWVSEPMCGIYMSLLLKPEITADAVSQITLVSGLSVQSALKKLSSAEVMIKWPNDIVLDGKKVCGILTELAAEENSISYVVTGIGINVNNKHFPGEISDRATSLAISAGKTFDRNIIIAAVLNEFEKYYNIFMESGFSALKDKYEKNCITVGKDIRVITPSADYTAHAAGISPDGRLIAEHGGKTEIINSGEVSVRGICGYI